MQSFKDFYRFLTGFMALEAGQFEQLSHLMSLNFPKFEHQSDIAIAALYALLPKI
jgi:hypothetical protein